MHSNLPITPSKLLDVAPPRRLAKVSRALRSSRHQTNWAWLFETRGTAVLEFAARSSSRRAGGILLIKSRPLHSLLAVRVTTYDHLKWTSESHTEVKATACPKSAAFFISANRVRASVKHPDEFRIYRVFGLRGEEELTGYYARKDGVTEVLHLVS
ncbi:protein NO VEIN domain-containing protein [Roseateles chitinivorans]|uniref:protein NO VEIN domain-containing protein n=1 Tax=Roseateles chitinivorans TaxID=2917965 RepID=UPI003D6703BB